MASQAHGREGDASGILSKPAEDQSFGGFESGNGNNSSKQPMPSFTLSNGGDRNSGSADSCQMSNMLPMTGYEKQPGFNDALCNELTKSSLASKGRLSDFAGKTTASVGFSGPSGVQRKPQYGEPPRYMDAGLTFPSAVQIAASDFKGKIAPTTGFSAPSGVQRKPQYGEPPRYMDAGLMSATPQHIAGSDFKGKTAATIGFCGSLGVLRKSHYGEPPRYMNAKLEPSRVKNAKPKPPTVHQMLASDLKDRVPKTAHGVGRRAWGISNCMNSSCQNRVENSLKVATGTPDQTKRVTIALEEREKKVLYTSDEDSSDESNSSNEPTQSSAPRSVDAWNEDYCITIKLEDPILHYKRYVRYVDVLDGAEYVVKRSDGDGAFTQWPLFFVQMQENHAIKELCQLFDALQDIVLSVSDEMYIGAACIAHSATLDANARGVIVDVEEKRFKVHFIDYGNYETVPRDRIYSKASMPAITRQKAMAIPCILSSIDGLYCEGVEESQALEKAKEEIPDLDTKFRIRVVRKRVDDVIVVQVIEKQQL